MNPRCSVHFQIDSKYSEKYDTYYCELCNEWLEKRCRDFICIYCHDRPDRPMSDSSSKPQDIVDPDPETKELERPLEDSLDLPESSRPDWHLYID